MEAPIEVEQVERVRLPPAMQEKEPKKIQIKLCLGCSVSKRNKITVSGWWFQIFCVFIPTWGNDPISLIFLKGVETTNQEITVFCLCFCFWR